MEKYKFVLNVSKYDGTENYRPIGTQTKTIQPAKLNKQWDSLSEVEKEKWLATAMNEYIGIMQRWMRGVVIDGTWHKVLNA